MSRSSPSATPLWPLIYGLGIVAFSILLLALRAGIAIFLIFMAVGAAMIIFWVYYNARTKQSSDMKFIAKQPCRCAICSHEKASPCLEQECACCTVVKGEFKTRAEMGNTGATFLLPISCGTLKMSTAKTMIRIRPIRTFFCIFYTLCCDLISEPSDCAN
jgi:hypothetical protein